MDVNIALLTVTDTRTFDNDKSGAILVEKIKEAEHKLIDRKICKDNKEDIVKILKEWTNEKNIDVIITTGGTGLTGRDITPEAVNEIADKHPELIGFLESKGYVRVNSETDLTPYKKPVKKASVKKAVKKVAKKVTKKKK